MATREQAGACLPTAVWFLHTQEGQPLGQVYRSKENALPARGMRLSDGNQWKAAEIVSFEELRATCAMKRFRVVVRLIG